ncbi:hypothetical protein ACQCVH_19275 [Bacillus infantis]|uniref:hypothetical protein n=1 Tax=Bacillus infantis TaxID=324767 RepID=UPI003CE69707
MAREMGFTPDPDTSALGILMAVLELNEGQRIVSYSADWTPANDIYITFIIVAVGVSCFYLMFLFEAKKKNNFFEKPFWNLMPKVSISVGLVSVILFLVGGTVGPIMTWIEQWRSLL